MAIVRRCLDRAGRQLSNHLSHHRRISGCKIGTTTGCSASELALVSGLANRTGREVNDDIAQSRHRDPLQRTGRLTAGELAAADKDHDGTLTQDEYLAVVEQRFNAADPDKDGTLDRKELNSKAGQALLHLLR